MSVTTTRKLDFILRLVDRVSQPLGKVKTSFSDMAAQGQKGLVQMGVGMAGMIGAAHALKAAMAPALGQNAALGEVESLGVAADALELLNRKSLQFSIAYGESATSFVRSAYDIQSAIAGLTGNQLAVFTHASNVLAKATKADAATVTSYVGTMYGIFQEQADAMGKAAWVEQLTGQTATAVQMFKTTGQSMSNAFTALGASAASAGIQAAEQIAILGTLQATMSGGEAGTKYRAFLAGAYGAQAKLGLSFTDSQGRLLPMLDILDKLNARFGELDAAETDLISKAFGGKQAMGLITQLLPKTADLANSIDQLGKVNGMEQAMKMAQTIADPWERFEHAILAVRIAFGQKLLPILNPILERLATGGSSVVRWTTLFPNLTRLIGLTALAILGLTATVALLTFAFGVWRTAAIPVIALWKLLGLVAWRSVGAYLMQILLVTLYVAGLASLVLWFGLVKGAMLLWQAAIWLTNAALWANPVTWIVLGIIALAAVIITAIYFWEEWTGALMDTAAFQWISEQLTALSDWFDSMGGWSGMAKAAWNGITAVFHNAINGLIAQLNKIPGVDIKAQFGELPAGPNLDSLDAAQRAQRTINAAIPSLSPTHATAVPSGGLLTSIQSTTTQNRGTHVEKIEIHTNKPMTAHELEGLMGMAG
ncbi:phage tail tape measure protein [Pseudomonas sp. MF7453]|uniref:phage tail tape measure protein n=1 Tax=Pseudomonas sp. MF7453 TaxID=2797539 RepID=UPI0018E8B0FE|nr:phage tail tape measure protein [Pseudomonas sp. MF7453]MBJ2219606.1 phage tail tape measure protein [Pseudomonas sp. MF7453]